MHCEGLWSKDGKEANGEGIGKDFLVQVRSTEYGVQQISFGVKASIPYSKASYR